MPTIRAPFLRTRVARATGTACLLALALTAHGNTLTGWAMLPADTFAPGPITGQFTTPANGL